MILTVEDAIIARLKNGLGKSVKTVESYGGQFDDEGLKHVAKVMPALYVSFVGHKNPKAKNVAGDILGMPATFTVFVVTRNVASEAAGRRGTVREVGAYQLIEAVRRLLVNQDFGLTIEKVKVGPVQLLGNVKIGGQGLTVYGCGFETRWVEHLQKDGGLPLASDPAFAGLDGERADELPDLLRVGVKTDLGANGTVDTVDVVNLRERL
jgi:phage gp37-like protein